MAIISVDLRSRKPISEQLVERITYLVIHGFIAPDEQLPSVRSLATELGINPNTIQKAYSQLEAIGIIYPISGRGNFASLDISDKRAERLSNIMATIREACMEAKKLGASKDEMLTAFEKVWEEKQ